MPGNSKPLVSFICQKCSQPLKLDPSIQENNQLISEFMSNKNNVNFVTQNDQTQASSSDSQIQQTFSSVKDASAEIKILPSYRHLDNSTDLCNDFTIVGIPEVQTEEVLSRKMTMMCHLFDFLSGRTEIDHPLCEECTDNLLDQLDQQLSQAQSEYQKYSKLLEKFNSTTEEENSAKLDEELKKLEEEEARVEKEMAEVEEKQRIATEELAKEKKIAVKLKEESARYHEKYEEYKRQLFEYEDAQKGVDSQLRYASKQLERLTKTNVFNVTFHICSEPLTYAQKMILGKYKIPSTSAECEHEGHFGTINGFRMGRLPSIPVDWNEINAGWGQAALLLHSLANNIGLTFKKYKIVPYGNRSYIESLTDKNKEFPLYGNGGFKFFWDTKFDDGMVAFLECLQQFKEELEKRNPDCCMPYKMDSGRIQDSKTGIQYTIKVLLNSEEQWTKALKLMLTNLKWGLVWVAADGCLTSGEEMETISETPEDKSEGSLASARPPEKTRSKNKNA